MKDVREMREREKKRERERERERERRNGRMKVMRISNKWEIDERDFIVEYTKRRKTPKTLPHQNESQNPRMNFSTFPIKINLSISPPKKTLKVFHDIDTC